MFFREGSYVPDQEIPAGIIVEDEIPAGIVLENDDSPELSAYKKTRDYLKEKIVETEGVPADIKPIEINAVLQAARDYDKPEFKAYLEDDEVKVFAEKVKKYFDQQAEDYFAAPKPEKVQGATGAKRVEVPKGFSVEAFREMYGTDPLGDMAKLRDEYSNLSLLVDNEEKVRIYETAKLLIEDTKHPVNPIRPKPGKEQAILRFAHSVAGNEDLKKEVEAILAGRLAEAA